MGVPKFKMVKCGKCDGSGRVPDEDAGRVLKAERERLGIGFREMARQLDISRTYLADMEKGARPVTLEMAEQYTAKLIELCGANGHRK